TPLPRKATRAENYYQPGLDFDKDACYNVAAVDTQGTLDKGLWDSEDCRTEPRLNHQNVYVRSRCNHGYCAHMYAYYFELDASHNFDWEHVTVWTRYNVGGDKNGYPLITHVSNSKHSSKEIHPSGDIRYQEQNGWHPLMVAHYQNANSRWIRAANWDDVNSPPENHWKAWIKANLVGWLGFPSLNVQQKLTGPNFGAAYLCLKDEGFGGCLDKFMPDEERKAGFDVNND
ncbi:necrosis inducing protein, partial [Leptodontidium sp. MPI-SDFR-AT-0119]